MIFIDKMQALIKKWKTGYWKLFLIEIVIFLMQFQMVDFSYSVDFIYKVKLPIIFLNLFTYIFFCIVIKLFVVKWWIADLITSCLLGIFSVVNYYVILFHGTPLSYLEFANFTTAMDVIGNYSFSVTKRVIAILLLLFLTIACSLYVRKLEGLLVPAGNRKRCIFINFVLFLIMLPAFWRLFVLDNGFKEKMVVAWNWHDQYTECRVFPCFIESFVHGLEKTEPPEGYSVDKVQEIQQSIEEEEQFTEEYPDIILILNETFYDPDLVTDIDADSNYLKEWEQLDNKIYGYAVCPSVGGGTNSSEYELLTSNSLQLLGNITPFTSLDLKDANSIVNYLKSMGYYTMAAHPAWGSNYMRNTGYVDLGFDEVHFLDDFTNLQSYYNRNFPSDASVYDNMKNWYENMPDGPRFLYLLTIQNHGDWNRNENQYDTVHTGRDFGIQTTPVNEYLTSLSQSDQAFADLISYYKNSERPVIICMVGDHAPSFVTDITDNTYTEEEKALLQRSVPFVIWSNMIEDSHDVGTTSMVYLMPSLLQTAGMPLSDYYTYLVTLKDSVPVLSSYGVYYDPEGEIYQYDEPSALGENVNNYFILEYNNIFGKEDRVETLFTIKETEE